MSASNVLKGNLIIYDCNHSTEIMNDNGVELIVDNGTSQSFFGHGTLADRPFSLFNTLKNGGKVCATVTFFVKQLISATIGPVIASHGLSVLSLKDSVNGRFFDVHLRLEQVISTQDPISKGYTIALGYSGNMNADYATNPLVVTDFSFTFQLQPRP